MSRTSKFGLAVLYLALAAAFVAGGLLLGAKVALAEDTATGQKVAH